MSEDQRIDPPTVPASAAAIGPGPSGLRGSVLIVGTMAFVLVGAVLIWLGPRFLLRIWLPQDYSADDLRQVLLPATQAVLFVLGGFIAVIGVVVSLSRHRQELAAATRDHARYEFDRLKEDARLAEAATLRETDQERSLRERFVAAVELLADRSSAIKRTAALYAIASLADDWGVFGRPGERQVCVDVLCGYLRSPQGDGPTAQDEVSVRQTGFALIRSHLSSDDALWSGCAFVLRGARIDYEVDLRGVVLESTTSLEFDGARFEGAGQLVLRGAVGSGTIDLRNADLLIDETEATASTPTIDLRDMAFDQATIDLTGLRMFGQASIDLDQSRLDRTQVRAARMSLDMVSRFSFRPGVVHDGSVVLRGVRLAGRASLAFDHTRYSGGANVVVAGAAEDTARLEIGTGEDRPFFDRPDSPAIELLDDATFTFRTFLVLEQSVLEVRGATVAPDAVLDLRYVEKSGSGTVPISGIGGHGRVEYPVAGWN